MRVAITGATGLLGRRLTGVLVENGDEVVALSRNPDRAKEALPSVAAAVRFERGKPEELAPSLSGVDAVVNLAGEPILGRRWNVEVKEEIRHSRTEGTRTVVDAMRAARGGPRVLVNASAVGWYGDREEPLDEGAPPGDDYLASVCRDWEAAAAGASAAGIRTVIVRVGVVLSRREGAMAKMVPAFRWFLGGPVGNGRQGFSWVHIDDVAGILAHAVHRDEVSGILNATAPNPVSNREFCAELGRVLHRPSWLPVPKLLLRISMGEVATMLVTGQFVVPRRTLETGYRFRHSDVEGALRDLLA